jgi:multidrug resistance efflux pump
VRKISRYIALAFSISLVIMIVVVLALILGRMDETVECFGSVRPSHSVRVSSEIGGIVREVKVHEGDSVQPGDTLFILYTQDLEYQVARSRQALSRAEIELATVRREYENLTTSESYEAGATIADLMDAKKRVDFYKSNYDRAESLFEKDLISLEERERERLNYELSESNLRVLQERLAMLEKRYQLLIEERKDNVDLARAEFALSQDRLEKAVVTSPLSGTILTPETEQLKGIRITEGQPLIQIGNLGDLYFVAGVDESDIARVLAGQKVKLFLNAFPYRQYKVFIGEVVEVSTVPHDTKSGFTFEVKVRIDEPWVDEASSRIYLKSGMSGRAEIVIRPNARLIETIIDGITQ